jgi:hypothetical protein
MTTDKGNTMNNIAYRNCVTTQMVLDTSKPLGNQYVANVWQDTENEMNFGQTWHINDGSIYLYGFATREEAVQGIITAKAVK